MKIRVVISTESTSKQIVTFEDYVREDGDLTRIVSQAIVEARKQNLQPWGWSLSVEKADEE